MGLLKKIFKPVSKVLDKIIPNEIKPALPYLAAFAPMFGPAQGLMGQGMLRRALISGGLNIGAQLAQEGNEGEVNLLSAGLGALTGAMTAPGAGETFKGMQTYGGRTIADIGEGTIAGQATGLEKLKNIGLEGLAKGSDIMAAGMADPFSKAGLKAATLPAATATGDVMQAEARRLEKQAAIDAALAEAEALGADADRAAAIRLAMQAYGFFTDEEIEDTISSAGYRAGGRVGLESGGGLGALARGMQGRKSESSDLDLMTIKATLNQVYTNNDDGERGGYEAVMEFMEKNPEYKVQILENIIGDQGNKIMVAPLEKAPINILDSEGIKTIMVGDGIELMMPENKAKGGRVGFKFGGIDEAIEMVEEKTAEEGKEGIMQAAGEDPLLVEEYNKYVFDLMEQRPNAKPMSFQEFKRMVKAGMKEGGRVGLREGGGLLQQLIRPQVTTLTQGPIGSFQPLQQAQAVFPRLNELEQGVNRAEGSLNRIRNRLGEEQRGLMGIQPFGLRPAFSPFNMGRIPLSAQLQVANRGGIEPQGMKEGGLMDLGGKEMDLRGGGFVPIGKKERADDVPARLSKNEFVMTADAVRAAGGGSVNKGAKRMYNLMNTLEARA